jgi:hypothetical protein
LGGIGEGWGLPVLYGAPERILEALGREFGVGEAVWYISQVVDYAWGANGVESVSNMLRRGMRQAALFSRLVPNALDAAAPSWRFGTDVVARSQICSLQP